MSPILRCRVQCWLEGVEGQACRCKIVRSECLSDAVWRRCAVGEAGSWGLEECVIACILVSVIVCILIIVKRLVDHQYGGAGRRLVGRQVDSTGLVYSRA